MTWPWTVPVAGPATDDEVAVVAGEPDVVTVEDGGAEVGGGAVLDVVPPDVDVGPPEVDPPDVEVGPADTEVTGRDPTPVESELAVDPATVEVEPLVPDRLTTRRPPVDVQATTDTTARAPTRARVS